ncbi:hypothetical protein HG531_011842 [Fusarium graminearum]|nr:hypothetical protein HG531_011842 [Fusarium graminearum]
MVSSGKSFKTSAISLPRSPQPTLSTTESTGDGDSTTLDTGEKGIEDSLADNERLIGRLLVVGRTGHSDGPGLHHGVLGLLAIELDLENVVDDSVLALGGDLGNSSSGAGREQNLVVGKERVLKDGTPNITTREVVADLDGGRELPLLVAVEGRNGDTAGNVNGLGHLGNGLERTLDTVVDTVEQTGAELDGQGLSGSVDGVTNHNAGCDED